MVKPFKINKADPKFVQDLKNVSIDRIKNGMENDKISYREVTRMAPNSKIWNLLLHDLKTQPRKKT